MSHSITSIRLSLILSQELEKASQTLHRGKNWIITKALEDYLSKVNQNELAREARRQSLRASKRDKDSNLWQKNTDTSGWT